MLLLTGCEKSPKKLSKLSGIPRDATNDNAARPFAGRGGIAENVGIGKVFKIHTRDGKHWYYYHCYKYFPLYSISHLLLNWFGRSFLLLPGILFLSDVHIYMYTADVTALTHVG